ncbi:MAG: FAD-dependent oxidoreductase [Anaerovoracaceae bacterium]
MYKVIVIGGGWSGCAAAIAAKKAGASVTVVEKTDLLLGLGNVGGIMRNNGRYTAAEENIALGAWELFDITDRCSRHTDIDFPGHKHASLYDVMKVEPEVRRLLKKMGIQVRLTTRVIDVNLTKDGRIESLVAVPSDTAAYTELKTEIMEADAFVECTGSTGPMGNCVTYGNGCCMCILRCPAFGPRVSISQKAGAADLMGMRKDGSYGAFSGSGKLEKATLSEEIRRELDEKGVAVIPVQDEEEDFRRKKLDMKVCQQYALGEYAENIILLDTGYAKIMTPFYPLEKLRKIKGFENARYADPYAGGKGNSIRYLSVTERETNMQVSGVENLFCGGEKSGLFVGHTEAISTGSLAGNNCVRYLAGAEELILPDTLAIGDLVAFAKSQMRSEEGLKTRFTFAGAEYFKRMKEKGLYSTDREEIRQRVEKEGLTGIYELIV